MSMLSIQIAALTFASKTNKAISHKRKAEAVFVNRTMRDKARIQRDRAEAELAAGCDDRLDFAALSLRKAIEYLAYDRLDAYKREINPEIFDSWQPKKVIERLLEMDPLATTQRSLGVAIYDDKRSIQDQNYIHGGTEIPISIEILSKPYSALGSYLHAPTRKNISVGKTGDSAKLRALCERILSEIDKILSSTLWSTAIGNIVDFECSRCGNMAQVRKMRKDESTRRVWCSHCNAPYTAHLDIEDNKVNYKPHAVNMPCISDGCEFNHELWEDDFRYEKQFRCQCCNALFRYIYSVQPLIESEKA